MENNLVEAIIAPPTQAFYKPGINEVRKQTKELTEDGAQQDRKPASAEVARETSAPVPPPPTTTRASACAALCRRTLPA